MTPLGRAAPRPTRVRLSLAQVLNGSEVVWQSPGPSPAGTLFVAHGCNHGGNDFWPGHAGCSHCTGLPEEVAITKAVLARNYVMLAISSQARKTHRCWNPTLGAHDGDMNKVIGILDTLARRQSWTGLPLYAMGASSGGAFVLTLAAHMPLAGVCSQISGVSPALLQAHHARFEGETVGHRYPPTMFVHMPRDAKTAQLVAADIAALRRVVQILVAPSAMNATTLSDRCAPEIGKGASAEIFKALTKQGILDAQGFLSQDPRGTAWREALRKEELAGMESMRWAPDLSPVSEELNVMFAGHEIVSDTTGAMLDFFERAAAKA
ncbi:MAG: hypothetical protein WDW38_004865 [Sanguina aurantia]